MCLSPVTIVNPTRYVSLRHSNQMLLQVPCGHCAECQKQLAYQWQQRTIAECIESPYVLFDTLTYSDEYLPMMSHYYSVDKDYPCFDSRHLRLFFKRLRITLERKYNSSVRYFLSSEYGDKKHRPHYHLLLFPQGNITPIQLSKEVACAWKYGRTDGVPFRSAHYVISHNLIANVSENSGEMLRVANYVTKYVQKSCTFQRVLNKRIAYTMHCIAQRLSEIDPGAWLETIEASLVREQLKRRVNQFHLQSQMFGMSILRDLDLKQLFEHGCLYMPHHKYIKIPVSLSNYYKRKLFYDMVKVDGCRAWQLNELGRKYKEYRRKSLIDNLTSRFSCIALKYHLNIDAKKLADYVLNKRGRLFATHPEATIEERYYYADYFGYITRYDKLHLGQRGYCRKNIGNTTIGFTSVFLPELTIRDILSKCYMDGVMEKQLDELYKSLVDYNNGQQRAFELRQRLLQVFKPLRCV